MLHWTLISCAVGLIACILGIAFGWGIFPIMIHKKVVQGIVIKKDTPQYDRFVSTPQAIDFKVYIFNITNPEQIQNGEIPIVKEVGPYIYKQYRNKEIMDFSNDGTRIKYKQTQTFYFDDKSSAPLSQSDNIVALNMHMNGFIQAFEGEVRDIFKNFVIKFNKTLDRTPIVRLLKRVLDRIRGKRKSILQVIESDPGMSMVMGQVNANLNNIFNNPTSMFVTTTVKNYLFDGVKFCSKPKGFGRAICKILREKNSQSIHPMEDGSLAFSLFKHKNGTSNVVYEVDTGLKNPQDVLKILSLDNINRLYIWLNKTDNKPSICDMINGTDGSIYPPFLKQGASVNIFSPDICRSVQLFYEGKIKYQGISGYRYIAGGNFLNEIGPEFNNECFCVDKLLNVIKRKNGCLYRGAIDLSNCLNAPVIVTLPHMLGAAKEYRESVKGLKPDEEKHKVFIDVQDITGTPLQGGKRVQFNMFLKQINRITLTENITTSLLPTIWVEESIALNPEMVELLKSKLIKVLTITEIIYWTLSIGGLIIFVISLFLHIRGRQKCDNDIKEVKS